MTSWFGWVVRRASASRILLITQLLLVMVTTGIIAGTLGWSEASATTAARTALGVGTAGITGIEIRMRQAPDTEQQDQLATSALIDGFEPAPVLVTHELQDDPGGGTGFAVWRVEPDLERIQPVHLGTLAAGAEEARRLVAAADLTGRGITHTGDLAATAHSAGASWSAARALAFVPLSVLVLVTVLGVTQVAGLLAGARESEVHLMLARGARPLQLMASEIAESVAITLGGTAIGTLGALGVLEALTSAFDSPAAVVSGGLSTGALIVLTLAVTTALQIRRTTRSAGAAVRIRAVAGGTALLLVGVASGVTLWQIRRVGSIVSIDDDGDWGTDLVAAAAPALLLLSASVVGLILLGPATRLAERFLHIGSGVTGPLAASQVSRRLTVQAVPVVLTILATSTTTLAAFFAGTAHALDNDLAQLRRGAELRVVTSEPVSPAALPADPTAPLLTAGANTAAPVWLHDTGHVGDTELPMLVAPLPDLADVAVTPQGVSLPDLGAEPSRGSALPLTVPAGTDSLELSVTAQVFLNEWEQLAFDQIHDFAVAETSAPQYGSIRQEDLDELALQTSGRFWASAAEPVTIRPSVFLRNVNTGQGVVVRGGDLRLEPEVRFTSEADVHPSFIPAEGTTSVVVPVAAHADLVIDSIGLELVGSSRSGGAQARTLDLTARLTADGSPLFGGTTEPWTANYGVPAQLAGAYLDALDGVDPSVTIISESFEGGSWTRFDSNEPWIPPLLDTSGDTWTWTGWVPGEAQPLRVAPGLRVQPDLDPLGVTADVQFAEPAPVRVALTAEAAQRADLQEGDTFEIGVLQWTVPAVLDSLVSVVPGLDDAASGILDSAALGAYLAHRVTPLPWPTEVWADTDDPDGVAQRLAESRGVTRVSVTATDESTPVSATAFNFLVASAGAVLLAVVGILAAGLTQLTARRPEVATLRAVGIPARTQAFSRVVESALTLVPATVLGVGAGWLVGALVVGTLATSAVGDPGGLTPELRFEPLGWAVLLGSATAVVSLAVSAVAMRVSRQAVDREYREEVR